MPTRERLRAAVRGAVQGVGFRPFVHRLATGLGLDGWVLNSPQGVFLEVEGPRERLELFLRRLVDERPPRSSIQSLEHAWLDPAPHGGFTIRESRTGGASTAVVMPDIATCVDCLRELFDPGDRRHRYPFLNCTNCGPRYSIIERLPYDRPHTSMRRFGLCEACRREYEDPLDRRFHAQPTACPACGPRLALLDASGVGLAEASAALASAVDAIRDGQVVAVKGLGGFHLVADACLERPVMRLRARKHRDEKPFAVMAPSIAAIEGECLVSEAERRLLTAPEAPIVLLDRRPRSGASAPASGVADAVAPGHPTLGVLLPYTPLHHLLLRDLGRPIVATSGNLADEPICIDEREAVSRLAGLADLFLVHDRPIVRHVDDSIVRIVAGRELVTRRARGYAPLPVPIARAAPPLLAVGAHLKNAVAVTAGANVVASQHIGDLETLQAEETFHAVMASLRRLYDVTPERVIADLHPDYVSTQAARKLGLPLAQVQHHYAHVAACMAENALEGRVLGVAWDGAGYGTDGTIWGGEFLLTTRDGFERVGCLRPFRLAGGDLGAREPRRAALGVLARVLGPRLDARDDLAPVRAFSMADRRIVVQAIRRGINAPVTTSAGRLFDALAAILGLCQVSTFEGQAAMRLEHAAGDREAQPHAMPIVGGAADPALGDWRPPGLVLDWGPLVEAVLDACARQVPAPAIAARVHESFAQGIVAVAREVGEPRVVLSGGCFQNRRLVERTIARLREAGLRPYWHQRIPPNDGGIAVGQIAAWLRTQPE